MSSKITKDLVNKAKNGDAEAFGELYEAYAKDMFRFACYYTGSSSLAEDCVSESVCIAFEKIATLKKADAFKSWIFKILFNCCKKALSEKIRQRETVEISAVSHLSAALQDENEKISLQNALEKLSEEERDILILHYSAGYTSKEIGEMLNLKDATVRSKMMRATAKLREMLHI